MGGAGQSKPPRYASRHFEPATPRKEVVVSVGVTGSSQGGTRATSVEGRQESSYGKGVHFASE